MIKITINGIQTECERGEYLYDVASRMGIEIPTLCRHEGDGLADQGCCRLCVAEVIEGKWSKIVVSCVYPIERECEILTESDRVLRGRRSVLMLLAKRAPDSPEIKALCEKYGAADGSRYTGLTEGRCVMCGLCAKACAALGSGAISTVGRGVDKRIATPYDEPSEACVGCLSCANVCPTGAIEFEADGDSRSIWGRRFELVKCERCGAPLGTKEEIALASSRAGGQPSALCPECRRAAMTDVMARTYGI